MKINTATADVSLEEPYIENIKNTDVGIIQNDEIYYSNENNNTWLSENIIIGITIGLCVIVGVVLGIIVAKKVANK